MKILRTVYECLLVSLYLYYILYSRMLIIMLDSAASIYLGYLFIYCFALCSVVNEV